MRMTVPKLLEMKQNGEKITQVTCYDYSMAKLVDAAGIHTILVGDSLGMTMQGYPDTLPVTMDEMIVYGRSVVRGAKNPFIIMDMPFMSYQVSVAQEVIHMTPAEAASFVGIVGVVNGAGRIIWSTVSDWNRCGEKL